MRHPLHVMFLTILSICLLSGCQTGRHAADSSAQSSVSSEAVSGNGEAESGAPEASSEVPATESTSFFEDVIGAEGKVYNIYAADSSFLDLLIRCDSEYIDHDDLTVGTDGISRRTGEIGNITVRWTIGGEDTDAFTETLDEALLNDDKASADERIDLFLTDGSSIVKYCDADAGVTLTLKDIGISASDLSDQFPFTRSLGKDADGEQRALTWQVPSGGFVYRRSIAKEVLGTDDPNAVQESMVSWGGFKTVAVKMAASGYQMLSGYTDAFAPYACTKEKPWADSEDRIQLDQNLTDWVRFTKEYTDSGMNHKTEALFSEAWQNDLKEDSSVFGFFLTSGELASYIRKGDASLTGAGLSTSPSAESISGTGDWAVVEGPAAYYRGGAYLCAGAGTDNEKLTRSLIKDIVLNKEKLSSLAISTGALTNSVSAMEKLSSDLTVSDEELGGENPFKAFTESAKACSTKAVTLYDEGMNAAFISAFIPYFKGETDEAGALKTFYYDVLNRYPDLLTS
jgi:multiple sugar transport system substrate-binding protein